MFSRTAEKASSGTRSIKPVFKKLQPQQRLKLEKSSKKVGQILGEMPVIDIVPASPTLKAYTDKPLPEIQSPLEKRGKKAGKGGKAKAKSPPAPVLRYKLTPEPASAPRPATPNAVATLQVPGARPRKAVPYLLDLPSPASMRRYSRPGFLSPLSPLSPFSPIETSDMREERYHGLRRLARVSRAFRDTIVEELPSIAQTASEVDALNSYLDLYRMATKSKRMTCDSDAYTAYAPCTPDLHTAYTACSITSRRRSMSLSHAAPRRSMHSFRSITPTARTSFIVPHSASVYSPEPEQTPTGPASFIMPHSASLCTVADKPTRYTLVINVPSPATPTAQVGVVSTTPSDARMSYTIVLNVPPKRAVDLPETPFDEESPLQRQQRDAQARAAILAAMAPLAPAVPLHEGDGKESPLPTALARLRSPRVPYWVRGSYAHRAGAQGYVRRTHSYARRSGVRVPPTPRTMRKERRQGWGGQWRDGRLADAVEELKQIKTPAPRVLVDSAVVVGEAH